MAVSPAGSPPALLCPEPLGRDDRTAVGPEPLAQPIDRAVPSPPQTAHQVFGTALPLVERYAALLAGPGVERGLIGPRETPRLWERHLLNCAGLAELLPDGAVVADVGSGAGLPGVVLAALRPDVTVVLVEPLLRRATFLEEVVAELGLRTAVVRRARAEELAGSQVVDVVVARAVAPLDRLAGWCLPLLAPGGRLLALKGERADDELAASRPALTRAGAAVAVVVEVGDEALGTGARVVVVTRGTAGPPAKSKKRRR
jgi:16S rRNA (guanine527-N7)-methyltransferase